MAERSRSTGLLRALTWIPALVLIAGVAAFITVSLGNSSSSTDGKGETLPEELPVTAAPNVEDVPAAARRAAAAFIEAAVAREDLARAWPLAHPQLKKDCACTREEWLTGNIPVQFYPAAGADEIRFAANEIAPGRVVLEVLLAPKKGWDLAPMVFYIGLKSVGSGDAQKWLVDYWAPAGSPPVPTLG